jgi:acetyl-CoA carboxylase biotin carboxyl carrier protein
MELSKIKSLIDLFAVSDLTEIELIEGDHRVRLARGSGTARRADRGDLTVGEGGLSSATEDLTAHEGAHGPGRVTDFQDRASGEAARPTVVAPLFGMAHLTPSPGASPFVNVGDLVNEGQTLCVIEAMKVFHEVRSPCRARIDRVVFNSGQEVQAGELLFELSSPI